MPPGVKLEDVSSLQKDALARSQVFQVCYRIIMQNIIFFRFGLGLV